MIIPNMCSECNDFYDLDNPKVTWMNRELVLYFHCKNQLCTRVLYTNLDIHKWMRVWMSGELILNKIEEYELRKNDEME